MRKWIVVLVCLVLFTACSTGKKVSTQEIAERYTGDFSFAARGKTEKDTYAMEGKKNGGSITLSVLEPKELNGLSITMEDGKTKVAFAGMEKEFVTEALPEGAPFRLLETAFTKLQKGELSAEEGGNGLSVFGEAFSGTLSGEDLSLLSLSFPTEKTDFSFSDFAFSEEK